LPAAGLELTCWALAVQAAAALRAAEAERAGLAAALATAEIRAESAEARRLSLLT